MASLIEQTTVYGGSNADATTQADYDDMYHGQMNKTVLYPIFLLVGTVGNVLTLIIILRDSRMISVPTYFGFAVIAVCDTIILWLFSGSDWLVATFSIDPYSSPNLLCQISACIRQTIITFNDWWLTVIALLYYITKYHKPAACCLKQSMWLWLGVVMVPSVAVGVVIANYAASDAGTCIHIMSSVPVERFTDILFCLCGLFAIVLIILLIARLVYGMMRRNFEVVSAPATPREDQEIPDEKPEIKRFGVKANFTLIILLVLLELSVIPIYPVVFAIYSIDFSLWYSLNENFYDAFISVKFIIYVITCPDFRRGIVQICSARSRIGAQTGSYSTTLQMEENV